MTRSLMGCFVSRNLKSHNNDGTRHGSDKLEIERKISIIDGVSRHNILEYMLRIQPNVAGCLECDSIKTEGNAIRNEYSFESSIARHRTHLRRKKINPGWKASLLLPPHYWDTASETWVSRHSSCSGIQPHFCPDISSSRSSERNHRREDQSRLTESLAQERSNITISSDDSTESDSSRLAIKRVRRKNNEPDEAFLSSQRDNQSIDDVGDESVVDWLANETATVQADFMKDTFTNSFDFSIETRTNESPVPRSTLITPRKLHYNNHDELKPWGWFTQSLG
eukprot:CCRYP_014721-RB/>CCRYP_014721-RB protein AED:0.46 eAED:1.00 QI:0/0/0/1/0/0/2/0/280